MDLPSETGTKFQVKHVERDGCLWVISETAPPAVVSVECDFKSDCSDIEFDQLTLDVTPHGTVVLLKKLFSDQYTEAFVDSFYFIKIRNPRSLLMQCFLAIIKYFPKIRNAPLSITRQLGIPANNQLLS
ncbi:unnamed protein product [Anisakis simplex]|uniref:SOCS box domain-containing protein n=1 Tax=Anisakis simplex TaxID=6269 RepID=A0A0M3J1Q2_ANISI|nr:unnamed protein product [Anisakis simplex]